MSFSIGGVTPQNKPAADWVDASVADWIESETKLMDEVWGPGEQRSALAFVHIPPSVQSFPFYPHKFMILYDTVT